MCFQVKNCGTNFRWNMFGMTIRDSDNLAFGLKSCKNLRKLCISNSSVDDDKFYAIYDGIKHVPVLGQYLARLQDASAFIKTYLQRSSRSRTTRSATRAWNPSSV